MSEAPEGWTKREWNELVETVKSRDRKRIVSLLEKHKDYEFGTPLMMDIAEILKVEMEDLVNCYGSFIPVSEVLRASGSGCQRRCQKR